MVHGGYMAVSKNKKILFWFNPNKNHIVGQLTTLIGAMCKTIVVFFPKEEMGICFWKKTPSIAGYAKADDQKEKNNEKDCSHCNGDSLPRLLWHTCTLL